MKSGDGDLDFSVEKSDSSSSDESQQSTESEDASQSSESSSSQSSPRTKSETTSSPPEENSPPPATHSSASTSSKTADTESKYPYFVRRNKVSDERDNRLEIHVRDKVVSSEASFRSRLADRLNADEISKTDAREFALLAAYEHPELVAELMEAEGFSELS